MRRVLAGVIAAIVALPAGALSYRAWRQHEVAQTLAVAPRGIDESAFVRFGGVEQYLTIRGDDRANPVILFVHGGPGNSMVPFAQIYRPWEKHFTVVQWDQRGAGKTFGRNGKTPLSIDRIVRDGIEVAQYLRAHLHKEKVIVLAHSWGTVVGTQMIKRRPDLFAAYIGTGQVVAKEEKEVAIYGRTMKQALARHDETAVARLTSVGPPPYRSQHDLLIEREVSSRYDVASERALERAMRPVVLFYPGYSLLDIYEFLEAPKYTAEALYRPQLPYDARKLGLEFQVPVFIVEGEADTITPPDLAKAWFDTLRAPQKRFVVIKNAGHGAVLTMPDAFLRVVRGIDRALRAPPPR